MAICLPFVVVSRMKKVVICAEFGAGTVGGGESVIKGLIRGLAHLECKDLEVNVLCAPSLAKAMEAYTSDNILFHSRPFTANSNRKNPLLSVVKRGLGYVGRKILGKKPMGLPTEVPGSDPWTESFQPDVIHHTFPPQYFRTPFPAVYTLHDIQHEHLPEYFEPHYIEYRRMIYGAALRECSATGVCSQFSIDGIIRYYGVPASKLHLIKLPPFIERDAVVEGELDSRIGALPEDFVLFPAASYPHKNHLKLIEALSHLERSRGLRVPVVASGARSAFWPEVTRKLQSLEPSPAFIDLGYINDRTLRELYHRCRFVVFPTRFEGAGLPVLEAYAMGKAAVCADLQPFREYVGDAPIFFDPDVVESIANQLANAWLIPDLIAQSVTKGALRVAEYSWSKVAADYAELYHRAASLAKQKESSKYP